MLVFDECIAPRFPRPLVVDYVNLEETGEKILVGCGIRITQQATQRVYMPKTHHCRCYSIFQMVKFFTLQYCTVRHNWMENEWMSLCWSGVMFFSLGFLYNIELQRVQYKYSLYIYYYKHVNMSSQAT